MDLTSRKYKFIEQFMQIASAEKLKRIEDFLRAEIEGEDEIVAHTVQGNPLTKAQYVKRIKEADEAIDRGEYITHEELKRKVRTWSK